MRVDVPNLGNQVIYGVPGETTVGNRSPPSHAVCGKNVGMGVQMVCHRDPVVAEGGRDEAYPKGFVVKNGVA